MISTKHTLLLIFLLFVPSISLSQVDESQEPWLEVYQLEKDGLTKSALEKVSQILAIAESQSDQSAILKASLYQSKYWLLLEENAKLKVLKGFRDRISTTSYPYRNFYELIAAKSLSDYYQRNSYSIQDTEEKIDTVDFNFWNKAKFQEEIHTLYRSALEEFETVDTLKFNQYRELFRQVGSEEPSGEYVSDYIRQQALNFYFNNLTQADFKNFDWLPAIENYWDAQAFLDLSIGVTDSEFSKSYGFKRLQTVLTKQKALGNTKRYLHWELYRLKLLKDRSTGFDAYTEALDKLASGLTNEYKGRVLFAKAEILNQQGNQYAYLAEDESNRWKKKEAYVLCEEIIKNAPKSFEAKQAKVLMRIIEQSNLSVRQENFILPNSVSRVLVEFQNHKQIQFAIYKGNWRLIQKVLAENEDELNLDGLDTIKKWAVDLPQTTDFQKHATEVLVDPLAKGQYLLLAYDSAGKNILQKGAFQVTEHSFIELPSGQHTEYLISERRSGKPVVGAQVLLQTKENNYRNPIYRSITSDSNGRIRYRARTYHYGVFATLTVAADTTYFGDFYISQRSRNSREERINVKADIFTDRSIYRPGQMMYFKGVLSKKQHETTAVVSGEDVLVTVYDNNYDELYEKYLNTNAFGSFSDSLKIPKTVLPGEFTIEVEEGEGAFFEDILDDISGGSRSFRVENYKRPKFEVKAEPITAAYVMGDTVTFTGQAVALAGSNITNAKVKYSVNRTGYRLTNTADYYRTWNNDERLIVEGETITDDEGSFEINFIAKGDATEQIDKLPVFNYDLMISVTDINGETHALRESVSVGYHKAQASIAMADQMEEGQALSITVSQTNLNNQPLALNGTLSVYRLAPQRKYLKPRLWNAPDMPIISPEEFSKLFPLEPYGSQTTEVERTLVHEAFLTSKIDKIEISKSKAWREGNYLVEFVTSEKNSFQTENSFIIQNSTKPNSEVDFVHISVDKTVYQHKDKLQLKMYTSLDELSLTVFIEKGGRVNKEYIFNLSQGESLLKLPIKKRDLGGFFIHYLAQADGLAESGRLSINVPYEEQKINLETTSFRNKLEPGQAETWSFKVKGEKKGKVEAELLASMYDASLDQFIGHDLEFRSFYSNANYSSRNVDLLANFSINTLYNTRPGIYGMPVPSKSHYALSKFGYDFVNPRQGQGDYFDRFLNPNIVHIIWEKRDGIEPGLIKGVIRDNFGHVLANAHLSLVDSEAKTITNEKGEFTLKSLSKGTFLVSHPGYISQKVNIYNDNYFDLRLALFEATPFEVVVTDFRGRTPSKKLPFTVSTVEISASDAGTALAGKIAGVRVVPATSQPGFPGASQQIQIRGASSLAGNNSPLIVVDGVLMAGSLSDLNLQEALSYEVLKGAAAAALYGSRAANGVIMITTKEGRQKQNALFSQVKRRTNFNETAFFFPHLRTNNKGEVSFSFTTPESLTQWKFQLLAHTKTMLTSRLVNTVQTQKQLMVIPNFPRFVRESDTLVILVKVASLNTEAINGTARIEWLNPENDEPLKLLAAGERKDKPFSLSAKGNTSLEWKISIPEGTSGVKYRVLATADGFTDGEENYLPVLSNSIMVTESLPMWVNAKEEKAYDFKAVSRVSETKKNFSLTLELTNNPLWNAVQSLPYLIEFPFECSEQTFSRIFANALGREIVKSNPTIGDLIAQWSSEDKPGPLFANEQLKSIALKETPWLLEAKSEKARLARLAKLLNNNAVDEQLTTAINKLEQMQLGSGAFPWFSGSDYANRTITTHIVTGFGQLKKLNVALPEEKLDDMIMSAFKYLDGEFVKDYRRSIQDSTKKQRLNTSQIHYLYARSFFEGLYANDKIEKAVAHFMKSGEEAWLVQNLQSKAMLALIYHRSGNKVMSEKIMTSLEENSTTTDRGMYWLENESSFNWYQMPIETHALLMEAFDEVLPNEKRKQNLTQWLLQNKQSNAWSSTKATTSAIYALLNNKSTEVNESNALTVQVGNLKVTNSDLESPQLFTQKVWNADEIAPSMGQVKVKNEGTNPSWGAMHYQYFENIDNITQGGGSLQVRKEIFKVSKSENEAVATTERQVFQIGDRVKIRLLLSADRDMEFIHLKDLRAAGFEPLDVLSGYKNFGGANAYQAIDDTSIHFFFDRLSKGKYVIEYELIVNNAGSFSTGIATVESMYATEFNARAKSIPVKLIKQ